MPIDATLAAQVQARRILRLALGTAVSLWVSQAWAWPLSFIAPILTLTLLSLPIPRPGAKFFVIIMAAVSVSVYGSWLLLPMLLHQQMAGLLVLGLALFHSFYFTAKGGAAVVGTLLTVGMTLTVAVGSVSVDGLIAVSHGLTFGAAVGSLMAWLSHIVLPDPPLPKPQKPKSPPPKPPLPVARRHALRSLTVVLPITIWFLFSPASATNAAVMIKVAAMGEEVSDDQVRNVAKSLLSSTFFGGLAAVLAWQVLSVWPSLTMFTLLVLLAGLVFGQRIFAGAGLKPDGPTWSYAFLTMMIVLAPSTLDADIGNSVDYAFYNRLLMFVWATLYGVGAIWLFDKLWPKKHSALPPENPAQPAT